MGWLQDLLREVPLSSVLKERVELAEQKYANVVKENEALQQRVSSREKEIAELRSLSPTKKELSEDTARIITYLFKAEGDHRDVGIMARVLQMDKGMVKYHLDELDDRGFATCTGGNYLHGYVYWSLTSAGRRYAVNEKLV